MDHRNGWYSFFVCIIRVHWQRQFSVRHSDHHALNPKLIFSQVFATFSTANAHMHTSYAGRLWVDEGQGIIKNKQFIALSTPRSTPVNRWYERIHSSTHWHRHRHGRHDWLHTGYWAMWIHACVTFRLIVEFRLDWLFSYLLLCCQPMDVSTRIHFPIWLVVFFVRPFAVAHSEEWTAWVWPWLDVVQQQ